VEPKLHTAIEEGETGRRKDTYNEGKRSRNKEKNYEREVE
jgi:hypothetical protein